MTRTMSVSRLARAVVALSLTSVAALAGCSGSGSGDDPNTLRIAWEAGNKAAMEAVVARFKAQNPDVNVQVDYFSGQNMFTTLRTQFSAGTAPDIVVSWPGGGTPLGIKVLSKDGFLADLSEEPWVKDVPKALLPNMEDDQGRVVSFMGVITGFAPIYNNEAMMAAGLQVPTKWSEVIPFCKAARQAGKVAYAQGIVEPNLTYFPAYASYAELVYGQDRAFDEDMARGKAMFADSGWKTVLQRNVDMTDAGCFNDDYAGVDNVEVQKRWARGDALATFTHGQEILYALPFNPKATFTLAAYPADDNPDNDWQTIFQHFGLAVNAKGNVEMAKSFVRFFATPEVNTLYINSATDGPEKGAMPVFKDPNTWKPSQFSEEWTKYIENGRFVSMPENIWPNPEIRQALIEGMQDALAHRKSVDDVLAAMQVAYGKGGS
ncbi:ABC transporter substrate-binding protein [Phytohabitans sp. ZYX-F-186]|uniref:ABC transporter substrate-binding protein n=1 Tax=Phytohabitans maris TaxID=3071409 RepID=A0ABU0ZE97_9ACTN|nr:ABC transporter substrate-binding protein [Phytohabitans sp. ZYX-F-186]MDQ7904640.1 ABC transporter substrate-binding protein [Phytohabitans sp. ZYX-F-186]